MRLKILKNKEVSNASWLIAGKIVQMLLSLVVGAISARYLGPSNYGLISYANTFVAFFTAFCTLGINSVIVKELLDNSKTQGEALGSTILLRILSSLMSIAMIFGIVSVIDRDEPTTIIVVALSSISLLFHAFDTINYWFQSQYKSKVTAIVTLVAYTATSIYKICLLILGKSVVWFAFATSVDYIVMALLLCIAYKKYKGQRLTFSAQRSKHLLSQSYHYILSTMMVVIYGQTDKFMLKQMINESEVAYYTIAVSICSMWCFVLSAIIDSMYPTIVKYNSENKEAFEKKNRQLYAIVFYVSFVVSVAICLLGSIAIKILYGADFLPASTPLKIVTWYTAFSYLGVARNVWIVCEGCQKYLKYMYFGAAIINIGLNVLLIPVLGATGAALASLVTQLFTSIILPYCIKDLRPNAKLMLEAIFLRKIR